MYEKKDLYSEKKILMKILIQSKNKIDMEIFQKKLASRIPWRVNVMKEYSRIFLNEKKSF